MIGPEPLHSPPIVRRMWYALGASTGIALELFLTARSATPFLLEPVGRSTVCLFALTDTCSNCQPAHRDLQ